MKRDNVKKLGIVLSIIAILLVVFGYLSVHEKFTWDSLINDFYANLAAEIGSIAITIIIVDRIVRRQEEKQNEIELKNKLIRDIHSPVNSIANNAVHELRALGRLTGKDAWTKETKLGGLANLVNARLYDANFYGTSLIGANLFMADLRNVDFRNTDLTGVNLFESNIKRAKFNEYTILPDGIEWHKEIDLSNYVQNNKWQKTSNWLQLINVDTESINIDELLERDTTIRNVILYLKSQFRNAEIDIAEDEIHFLRHWRTLKKLNYQKISDIDYLLLRTKEARQWVWKDKMIPYLIINISYSIALEGPEHMNLVHWNEETIEKVKEARLKYFNL
ncbi:hypothetical protein BKI52_30175 [marine bacterium AO1-C]|nr:hypothetical protein BKI52_30175 [marine bacterium AO1-C]